MNDGKLIFLLRMGKESGIQTAFTRLVHCYTLLVIKGQIIEKNKLHNETLRHGHTNLTLPCSGSY